jgi:DNA topoisomerase III
MDLAQGLCLAFGFESKRKSFGVIEISNGDIVVPLVGHVLETARPGAYLNAEFAELERSREFSRFGEFLPILPSKLIKSPRTAVPLKGGREQVLESYKIASAAIRRAKEIVNAGDIDREGQLIVDELLEHLEIDPYGVKPIVWRFGIASNLSSDIAQALRDGKVEKNGDIKWRKRSEAAQARQYLDFAWGINLSMVGQARHRNSRISFGRVQTPVLNLVNERDLAIENFKPTTFYTPVLVMPDGMQMRWRKRDNCEGTPGFDAAGRIIDPQVGNNMLLAIRKGLPLRVSVTRVTQHQEKPPLPFSAGTLAATVAKEHGITLKEVQDAASRLNREHHLISYSGTDCKFLPESMHAQAPEILRVLMDLFPQSVAGCNPAIVSSCFNDAKLDEHYAIVPTTTPIGDIRLSPIEQIVYKTVSRRFMAQFYPDYVFRRGKLEVIAGADHFSVDSKTDVQRGWKDIENDAGLGQGQSEVQGEGQEQDEEQTDSVVLEPRLDPSQYKVDQVLQAVGARIETGVTTPPQAYTEDTLIGDMLSAYKFATNEADRALLKQIAGIGTSRTRVTVIENFIKNGFLTRQKKGKLNQLKISTQGRVLLKDAPAELKDVALTAKWERALASVEKGEATADQLKMKVNSILLALVPKLLAEKVNVIELNYPPGSHNNAYHASGDSSKDGKPGAWKGAKKRTTRKS